MRLASCLNQPTMPAAVSAVFVFVFDAVIIGVPAGVAAGRMIWRPFAAGLGVVPSRS